MTTIATYKLQETKMLTLKEAKRNINCSFDVLDAYYDSCELLGKMSKELQGKYTSAELIELGVFNK